MLSQNPAAYNVFQPYTQNTLKSQGGKNLFNMLQKDEEDYYYEEGEEGAVLEEEKKASSAAAGDKSVKIDQYLSRKRIKKQ